MGLPPASGPFAKASPPPHPAGRSEGPRRAGHQGRRRSFLLWCEGLCIQKGAGWTGPWGVERSSAPAPSARGPSSAGKPWALWLTCPNLGSRRTGQETLEHQQEGGGASEKLKERDLVLRSRGLSLPVSLSRAAFPPATPIPVLAEEPGPLHLSVSLGHPSPQGPRSVHWSYWLSGVSLDKEQGGEGAGDWKSPWVAASLPGGAVQAVGWPAWPFRALIRARK